MRDVTKLTEMQREVLDQVDTVWLRPMDMGGRDGTSHSAVLAALVRKGLVERQQRGGHILSARGSYVYRITTLGRAVRLSIRRDSADVEIRREDHA